MTPAPLCLDHLIRPATGDAPKPPVIFLFHGYGSNKEDLFSFASELPPHYCVISTEAPHRLQPFGFAWYAINFEAEQGRWSNNEQGIASRDLIKKFIEDACKTYQLNDKEVVLIGFSQGAILSLAVSLTYPELVTKTIMLSGYVNADLMGENYVANDFSKLKIYVSHGTVDQVIPISWAEKTPPFLSQLNINYIFETYPVGHGVAPQNFYSFKKWLME